MQTKLQRAGETVIIVGLLVFVLGGETLPVVGTIGGGIVLVVAAVVPSEKRIPNVVNQDRQFVSDLAEINGCKRDMTCLKLLKSAETRHPRNLHQRHALALIPIR